MAMLMSSGENAATLLYGPNGFRVIKPGRFVLCAVTGQAIAIEDLKPDAIRETSAVDVVPRGTDLTGYAVVIAPKSVSGIVVEAGDVVAQNVSTGSRRVLASFKGTNSAPAWSPDAKYLAVALSKDGLTQIYRIPSNGGPAQRLTESSGYRDRIRCPLPFEVQSPNSWAKWRYQFLPVFDSMSDSKRAGWSSFPQPVYRSTSFSRMTSGVGCEPSMCT